MDAPSSPVVIGVIAGLRGAKERHSPPEVADRHFVPVTSASLPTLFQHVSPIIEASFGRMRVSRLEDLTPDRFLECPDPARLEPPPQPKERIGEGRISRLQSTWRGLQFLVDAVADCDDVVVKVLDLSQDELARELKKYRGTPWEQSRVHKRIYDEALATLGGHPYTLLVCDVHLTQSPSDIEMLEQLSLTASAARVPCLFGIAPAFLHAADWRAIPTTFLSDWQQAASFNAPYVRFREQEEARYCVGIVPSLTTAATGIGVALNPGYVAAAAVGRMLASPDTPPSSFPAFTPQFSCPSALRDELRRFGLNLLDDSAARLTTLLPMKAGEPPLDVLTTVSRTMNALLQRVRELRDVPVPGREAMAARRDVAIASEWLGERFEEDGNGRFRLSSGVLSVFAGPTSMRVTWSQTTAPAVTDRPVNASVIRVLLADGSGAVGGSEPEAPAEPEIVVLNEYTLNRVVAPLRKEVTHGTDFPRDSWLLTLDTLADLQPLAIAQQSPLTRDLIVERQMLVDVGCYATADDERLRTLTRLVQNPSGIAGLAVLNEGFSSATSEPAPPVNVSDLEPETHGWPVASEWGLSPRCVEALLALDRWLARGPRAGAIDRRIRAVLHEIDHDLSGTIGPVISDRDVREWEARRRGLMQLVERLHQASVYPEIVRHRALEDSFRLDGSVREWARAVRSEHERAPRVPIVVLGPWRRAGLDGNRLGRLAKVLAEHDGLLLVPLDGDITLDLSPVLRRSDAVSLVLVRGTVSVLSPPRPQAERSIEFQADFADAAGTPPLHITAVYRAVEALVPIGDVGRSTLERALVDGGFQVRPAGEALLADFTHDGP